MQHNTIRPQKEPAAANGQDRIATAHRILVVDDEAAMRNLISSALVQSGYHVDAAEDGAAAWEALQAKDYDLLITDNNMPKVSGVDLLDKLHATAKALPVIMATGVAPEEEFNRRPWLQPAATLLKPFAIAELRETVQRILRQGLEPPTITQTYVSQS